MKLSEQNLTHLSKLAIEASKKAGEVIRQFAGKKIDVETKTGGTSIASQVVTKIDRLSQQAILDVLMPTCKLFDLGLLTEESEDDESRFTKDHFWCIDPLDGTLPFAEGKSGYAVSVSLINKNGESIIGVVHNPVDNSMYHAVQNSGAFKNNIPLNVQNLKGNTVHFFYDRSFETQKKSESFQQLLKQLCFDYGYENIKPIQYGGSVMNAIQVIESAPAFYLKYPKKENGGGSVWDFAATACIFKELTLHASDIFGNALDLNRPDSTFMNHKGVLFSSDLNITKNLVLRAD